MQSYRELGDRAGAVGASVRFGRTLMEGGEVPRATEVLESAVTEAEEIGDEPILAEALAHLARARMRSGRADAAVELADRSLAIAERLNLEPIVAEAFINKSAGLGILGRRRESTVLARAALELAQEARPRVVRDARAEQPRLVALRRRAGRGLADALRGTRARETDR